jgi:preprotein translocase subunit SecE
MLIIPFSGLLYSLFLTMSKIIFPTPSMTAIYVLGVVAVVAALTMSLYIRYLDYGGTEYLVTDQRLILHRGVLSGLIRRSGLAGPQGDPVSFIELSDINSVRVKGRSLYVGLPHGKGPRNLAREEGVEDKFGEDMIPLFTSLNNPNEAAKEVMDAINKYLHTH